MKIIDISREIFSCKPYEGDPYPYFKMLESTKEGSLYNVSEICLCTHIATHIDAPRHIDGAGVSSVKLENCVGKCTVIKADESFNSQTLEKILQNSEKRILINGNSKVFLNDECAKVLIKNKIKLIGTDADSIAKEPFEYSVHKQLLENDIVILEGLIFEKTVHGKYFLSALPLKMDNLDASPVRAVLITD